MSAASKKELSVVVPTYNETPNIRPLCERLFKATKKAGLVTELLFMDDDSGKGSVDTEAVVKALKDEGYPVRIHVRRKGEGRGLSSAVMLGITMANYGTILVMDADLQHEPEAVPSVAAPVLNGSAEFSVGSRNVEGGQVAGWSFHRKLISIVATLLAAPLTTCTDPMSGFFCVGRDVFNRGAASANTMGFKISLELMVRCKASPVCDVPITFRDRVAGESKLTMKQNFYYLRQLFSLYTFKFPAAFVVLLAVLVGVLSFLCGALL